jgi:hypothetical protein
MTTDLQHIEAQARSGALTLDESGLGSRSLAERLQRDFSRSKLVLTSIKVSTATDAALQFKAVADSLLGVDKQPMRALFFLTDGELDCLLTATLPDAWTFAWGYPDLPDYIDLSDSTHQGKPSFFGKIHFAPRATVIFSSVVPAQVASNDLFTKFLRADQSIDIEQIRPGLNYHGKLDIAETLPFTQPLCVMARIPGQLPCRGTLIHGKHEDTIELTLITSAELKKSATGQFAVGLSALVLSTTTSLYAPKPQSGISFVGHLGFDDSPGERHDVAIHWPVGSRGLVVSNVKPISFSGFDALVPAGHSSSGALKTVLSRDEWTSFEIREIVLGLSLSPQPISYLSCTIGSKANWQPSFIPADLADIFTIEEWLLRLDVLPRTELLAEMSLRIGGGLVRLSAEIPEMVFKGQLATGQEIDVNKLLAPFFPAGNQQDSLVPPASALKVRDLDIEVDFTNRNYLFDLEMAMRWEIKLGGETALALRGVRLSLQMEGDWNSVSVDCLCTIGGIDVELFASRSADVGGASWSFYGKSAPGQDIPFGEVMRDIAKYFGSDPEKFPKSLESFVVRNLKTEFTRGPQGIKTALFHCEGEWSIVTSPGKERRIAFFLTVSRLVEGEERKTKFEGRLSIGDLDFNVVAADDTTPLQVSDCMVATYSHGGEQQLVNLSDLLATITDADLSGLGSLEIDIKDALFTWSKTGQTGQTTSKYLFGIDIGAKLTLSKLPLVGQYFSTQKDGKVIGIQNLQALFASDSFTTKEVTSLNELLVQKNVTPLPDLTGRKNGTQQKPPGENTSAPNAMKKGLNIAAELDLGFTSQPLALPTTPDTTQTGTVAAAPSPVPNATVTDNAIWLNIQKSVGPVHIERVGVEYRASKLWVLVSGSLGMAGLTISLDGLSLGASLEAPPKIEPALRGLGLDYRNDFVEIGGAFLKMPPKEEGDPPDYSGAAVIKAKGLTISAFGSYTTVKDLNASNKEESSFFIYGLLDYPIGGPSFFFVTGLAAGFGYNRNLIVPPIERLSQFSLIKAAQKDQGSTTFTDVLTAFRQDIPASPGEHFLAAGIMFTSFKLVESTVIVTVAFGKRVELHLLGLSKLRVPAAEMGEEITPVAEVELAVKGSFIPDDGFLELRALLTPTSYLFEKDCHLTGGFAFLCWFKPRAGAADGDFVLTLGGYHPSFHVPAHYPVVPRLGFNWQVVPDTFSLSGDVYFALTPAAVMAGGHLQGEWHSGKVPYHYDATAYIDIGVEVTFEFFGTQRLSLDVGADLHIWGPKFAGEATIHLWIISFTIHFGDSEASKPKVIGWEEFKTSFLPKAEELCSIAVADGLVRKGKDGDKSDLGFINGKHFCLVTDSRIPSTNALHGGTYTGNKFGIAPVGIKEVSSSTHTITIMSNQTDVSGQFDYTAIKKNVPAALWGGSLAPTLNGPQFVENALSGFKITAKEPKEPDQTPNIKLSKLLIGQASASQNCHWGKEGKAFKRGDQIKIGFGAETAMRKRDALLKDLGLNLAGLKLTKSLTYDYVRPPLSEAA